METVRTILERIGQNQGRWVAGVATVVVIAVVVGLLMLAGYTPVAALEAAMRYFGG